MYNSEVKNNKYNYLTCRLTTGEEKVKYRNLVNPFLRYALSVTIESVPLAVISVVVCRCHASFFKQSVISDLIDISKSERQILWFSSPLFPNRSTNYIT